MDYKHRVPGNRRDRSARKIRRSGVWAALLLAAVSGLVGWRLFRSEGDVAQPPPPPAAAKTTQLPAPPIHQAGKAEDRNPLNNDRKEARNKGGGKAEIDKKPADTPVPSPGPVEPRFSFYKILPEKEVIIPENEIKTIKHEESLGNQSKDAPYMVQAGSFPNSQEADKMKEQLSRIKVKSRIENVKIDNAAWFRVKIGPFNSVGDADKVRAYLRANHIDSVVQKGIGR